MANSSSGTEVLYKHENKMGLTTLTFRKRRYVIPGGLAKGKHHLSASTGDLQSSGRCVMLDVGMFCPHCADALSAQLSESHSRYILTRGDSGTHYCEPVQDARRLPQILDACQSVDCMTQAVQTPEENYRTKQGDAKQIRTGAGVAEETLIQMDFDTSRTTCKSPAVSDKLSSSDYASLDRDSCFHSMNSREMSADTCVTSRRLEDEHNFFHTSSEGESSLNRRFEPKSENSDDSFAHLSHQSGNRNATGASSHKAMSASDRSRSGSSSSENLRGRGPSLVSNDSFDASRSEDNMSERSASPEAIVDDVLENMDGEIISGDATLRRIFAINKRKKSHRNSKSSRNGSLHEQFSIDSVDLDTPRKQLKPRPGEVIVEGTASMRRRKLHDMVKTKYSNIQKQINFGSQPRTDFSHETFFDEVMEALTDLEGGFTDWTSDYGSEQYELPSSRDGNKDIEYVDATEYNNGLGAYDIPRKTANSSCECIADEQSRYMDSSLEHIPSTIDTPSENSIDGYGSSSEWSDSGRHESQVDDEIFQRLVSDTQNLTEDLKVINDSIKLHEEYLPRYNKQDSPMREQCDAIDEVFIDDECSQLKASPQQSTKLEYRFSEMGESSTPSIPTIVEPDSDTEIRSLRSKRRSRSESSADDLDSSLENLLTCNQAHCSTSDLDEPFRTELYHAELLSVSDKMKKSDAELSEEIMTREESSEMPMHSSTPNTTCSEKIECVHSHEHNENRKNDDVMIKPNESIVTTDFDTDDSTDQVKDFMKYVLSQSCQTKHSTEHKAEVDACLDQVCQTCEFKPTSSDEVVKNEEVITKEVTLVFAWPKHMKIPKELKSPTPSKPKQPYRTIHLRRVMRVSDYDKEVIEGPTVQTVEYTQDGQAKKSITMTANRIIEESTSTTQDKIASRMQESNDSGISEESERISSADNQNSTSVTSSNGFEMRSNASKVHISSTETNSSKSVTSTSIVAIQSSVSGSNPQEDRSSDLVQEELRHYNVARESFKMPTLDMTITNDSEVLFDQSSSASMEMMKESQSSVDFVYDDHLRAMDEIYERANNDNTSMDTWTVSSSGDMADLVELRIDTDEMNSSMELADEETGHNDRASDSDSGKDSAHSTFDHNRRVDMFETGKYFYQSNVEKKSEQAVQTDDSDKKPSDQMAIDQETVCPRCSEFYIFDDEGNLRLSQLDLLDTQLVTNIRQQHPYPCERCIRLEREIKIKLEELTSMVETLGRRKSFTERKETSLEDLDSMSDETVENIRIIQGSIASLENARAELRDEHNGNDKSRSRASERCDESESQSSIGERYDENEHAHTSPVSYSTRVIKKKKTRKYPSLDRSGELFKPLKTSTKGNDKHFYTVDDTKVSSPINTGDETTLQTTFNEESNITESIQSTYAGQIGTDVIDITHKTDQIAFGQTVVDDNLEHMEISDINATIEHILQETKQQTSTEFSKQFLNDMQNIIATNDEIVQQKIADQMATDCTGMTLDTFADNLAKYIMFRAKLCIVLENPETRIPYLKNELAFPMKETLPSAATEGSQNEPQEFEIITAANT